jgi:hypothetical protein
MAFERPDPIRPEPITRLVGTQKERRLARSWHLATGTLACPGCDAPVIPAPGPHSPAAGLACPFCHHGAPLRDFLSLATPSRPARVAVRIVAAAASAHKHPYGAYVQGPRSPASE